MANIFAPSTSDLPRPPRRRSSSPSTHPRNPYAAHLDAPPSLVLPSIPPPTGLQEALGIPLSRPGPAAPDFNLGIQPSQAFHPATPWHTQPLHGGGARHYPSDGCAQGGDHNNLWPGALQSLDRSALQSGNDRLYYGHDAQRQGNQGLRGWTANRGYTLGYDAQAYATAALHHSNGIVQVQPGSAGFSSVDGVPLAPGVCYAPPYAPGNGHQSTNEYSENYSYNNDTGAASIIQMPTVSHPTGNGSAGGSAITQNLLAAMQPTGGEQSHVRGTGLSGPSAQMARLGRSQSLAVASDARSGGNHMLQAQNAIPRAGADRSGGLSLRSKAVRGQQPDPKSDQPGPQKSRESVVPGGQECDHGSDNDSVVFNERTPPLEALSPGELGHRVQQATAQSVEYIESESPKATGLDRGYKKQPTTDTQLFGSQISASHTYYTGEYRGASNATGVFDVSGTARRFPIAEGRFPVAPTDALRPGEAKTTDVPVVNLEEEVDEESRQRFLGEPLQPSAKGVLQESLPGRFDIGRRLFSSVVDVDNDEGRDGLGNAVTISEKDKPKGALSAEVEAVEQQYNAPVHDLSNNSSLPDMPSRLTTKRRSPRLRAGLKAANRSVLRPSLADDIAEENNPKARRSSLLSSRDSPNAFPDIIPLGARGAPAFRSQQLESNSTEKITSEPARTRTAVPKMDFDSDGDESRAALSDRAASITASGVNRKGKRSRPAAQNDNKATNENVTRPTRTSPRKKAGCSMGSTRDRGSNTKQTNGRSTSGDEKESADLASISTLDAQGKGRASRKRRGVHSGREERSPRKRSARIDGNGDKGANRRRVPLLSFDDEPEVEPSHKPSVGEDGSEHKVIRARRSSSGGVNKKAMRKRSVFEDDDVHFKNQESHSHGEDDENDSDDDFEAPHNPASRRRSTSGQRRAGRKTPSKKHSSSTHEKQSPVIQKPASLGGKASPHPRKRRAADWSESQICQLERRGSDDDETDADTNSPSQGGGSQGMNIVVRALPVPKKREPRYPDHLWDMMTSEELSTVRLGFVKYYPTPPSNMRAQGRFEQNHMREMPKAMVKALWENQLKPWSDRWWEFFTMFGEFVREKKKQKPRGKNPTVNQREVDRWAEEFHSVHGDARLPAPEETTGTIHAN